MIKTGGNSPLDECANQRDTVYKIIIEKTEEKKTV